MMSPARTESCRLEDKMMSLYPPGFLYSDITFLPYLYGEAWDSWRRRYTRPTLS
jgi:hypothetical protein